MKSISFHKLFLYWIVICCLCSLTEEKQKLRKIAGKLGTLLKKFLPKVISVKGLAVHEPANWTEAADHCQKKGKVLFEPRNWADIETVEKEIENRKNSTTAPINMPVEMWTRLKAGHTYPYFKNRDWLNRILTKLYFPLLKNITYYLAIHYSYAGNHAALYPPDKKLRFFCEKPTETTDEPPITSSSTTFLLQTPSTSSDRSATTDKLQTTEYYVTTTESTVQTTDSTLQTIQTTLHENESTLLSTESTNQETESTEQTSKNTVLVTDTTLPATRLTRKNTMLVTDSTLPATRQTSKNTVLVTDPATRQTIKNTVLVTDSTLPATRQTRKNTVLVTDPATRQTSKNTVLVTDSTLPATRQTSKNTVLVTDPETRQTSKNTVLVTDSTLPATRQTRKNTMLVTDSTLPATRQTSKNTVLVTDPATRQTIKNTVLVTDSTLPATRQTRKNTVLVTDPATRQTSKNTVLVTDSTLPATRQTSKNTVLVTDPATRQTSKNTVLVTDSTLPTTEEISTQREDISKTAEKSSLATQEVPYSTQEIHSTSEQTSNWTSINWNMTENISQSTGEVSNSTSTATEETSTEELSSYCEAKRVLYEGIEISLPETDFGQVAEPPCPKGTFGTVKWKCSRILRSFEQTASVTCRILNCSEKIERSNDTEYISYIVARLSMCEKDDDEEETTVLFDKMKQQRKVYKDMRGKFQANFNPGKVKKDMSMMLDMYDRLMDRDAKVWNRMKEETRRATSMEIIKETEETAWTIGCLMQDACMTKENLAVQIFDLHQDETTTDIPLALSSAAIGHVRLPGNLRPRTERVCQRRSSGRKGVVAAYRNVEYLNPNDMNVVISSGVIGVSVDEESTTYNLPDNGKVHLVLYHPPKPKHVKAHCVFLNWNATLENRTFGVWDTSGCESINSTENFTVCSCNHLTNFAVLMDFRGIENSERDKCALHILSLFCCSLSSIALLLTIIIYLTVRSLRSRRSTITCNLAICLLGMNILVQTGFDRVSTIVCKIVSAMIQYCVLSAFFWMLLEGALLYKMVIVVFETKKISLRILYAIGYGIPFFIVTLSSAVDNETMIRKDYCWPSVENGHIWSVVGPVVLVISVNFIILCLTLNAALKIDKMNTFKSKFSTIERKKIVKQRMKGVFSLMCLLGFTWTFGFFEFTLTPAAQYIFILVNGLQGVFLFVSQVILNDNVYRKLFAIYKENFARFSSVTSTWSMMASMKANPDEKPKPEAKEKREEEDEEEVFSSICINELDEVKIQPTQQASHADLCKVRLRIMELAIEPRDSHPFGLNQGSV